MKDPEVTYHKNISVNEILEKMNTYGRGIIFLLNEDRTLYGCTTDGDVRRALLNNDLSLNAIINKNAFTLPESTPYHEAKITLEKKKIVAAPLVDGQRKVVKFIFRGHNPDVAVVVMAGGLGKRLATVSNGVPKPMINVHEKPILERIVEQCKKSQIEKFIFCVNHKKEQIIDFFGNGKKFGVSISYIKEEKRMGTIGAISLIDKNKVSDFFILVNGDVLTNMNYADLINFHNSHNSPATVCLANQKKYIDFGVVKTDVLNRISSIQEKPTINYKILAGIYVFNTEIIDLVPKNTFFDAPEIIEALIAKGIDVRGYEVENEWLDVGRPDDLKQAEKLFSV